MIEKLGYVLLALGAIGYFLPRFVKLRSSVAGERELADDSEKRGESETS